ncbi:unnamed protein product, partial [Adineta steineri]
MSVDNIYNNEALGENAATHVDGDNDDDQYTTMTSSTSSSVGSPRPPLSIKRKSVFFFSRIC